MPAGIDCDTDYDKVTIRMTGEPPVIMVRPAGVPVKEWLDFWGVKRNPEFRTGKPFTAEDAEANNRRRLENMESR